MSVIYKAIRAIEAEDGRSAPRAGQAALAFAEGRRVSGAGIGLILTAVVVGLSAVVVLGATHFADRSSSDRDSRLIAAQDGTDSTFVDGADIVDRVPVQNTARHGDTGEVLRTLADSRSTNGRVIDTRDPVESGLAGVDHQQRPAPGIVDPDTGNKGSADGVRYSFRPAQRSATLPAVSGDLPASANTAKSVAEKVVSGTGVAIAAKRPEPAIAGKPEMNEPVPVADEVLVSRRTPAPSNSALAMTVESAPRREQTDVSPMSIDTSGMGGILYEDAQNDAPQTVPRVSITRTGDTHRVQYLNLRLSEALRVRHHDEVAAILKELQNIVGSDSAFMLKTRAYTQLALDGNIPHAMQLLREALARDPNDTEASINMAVAEIKIGEPQLARKRLKSLALLYPDDSRIVSLLKTLK